LATLLLKHAACALLTALASGCSPLMNSTAERDLVAAGRFDLIRGIDLPEVSGVKGCGAQALAAVLAYLDRSMSAESIAAELPWHDIGATPVDLLLEARRRGFEASVCRGTLETLAENVRAHRPMLVMLDAGLEVRTLLTRYPTPAVMHWAVVSGVARDGSKILLADERARHHVAAWKDFERRWLASDACMLVITRGGEAATARSASTTATGPRRLTPAPSPP
jgi:ABC-type bacteriocin/lantibiotic exporter with double-glycine peptidase domain